jgi:hypothetical protein
MATALIQFTQGANSDSPGKAVLGAFGDFSDVTVSNGDNTGVVSWTIYLLDVPSDSVLYGRTDLPLILAQAVDNTPTAVFTPDVAGTYRVMLDVTSDDNIDRDIRCFGIPDSRGFVRPPYQAGPDPLPIALPVIITQDPRPIKPDEQNYGFNVRGWAGSGGGSQLDDFLERHADLPFLVVDLPDYVAAALEAPLYVVDMPTIGVPTTFTLPASPREGFVVRIAVLGTSNPGLALTVGAQNGGFIGSATTLEVLGDSGLILVHRALDSWIILSVSGSGGGTADPAPRAPFALDYRFQASIDDANPGVGYLSLSQGPPGGQEAASDRLFLNPQDTNGADWGLFLDQFRSGYLRLESVTGLGWIVFEVFSVDPSFAGDYKRLLVSGIQSSDTDPFIHDEPIRIIFDIVRSREADPAGTAWGVEQSVIGWEPDLGTVLTVLSAGHAPGLYGVAIAAVVTTAGSPEGDPGVSAQVQWTSSFGAESADTEVIAIDVLGSHQIPLIVIRSDGSADVLVQFSDSAAGEVTNNTVMDIYAGVNVLALASD